MLQYGLCFGIGIKKNYIENREVFETKHLAIQQTVASAIDFFCFQSRTTT